MSKLICFRLEFPNKDEMHKERERFHLEMGLAAGIPKEIMDAQIELIGRTVWSHVYFWMKNNTKVVMENDK